MFLFFKLARPIQTYFLFIFISPLRRLWSLRLVRSNELNSSIYPPGKAVHSNRAVDPALSKLFLSTTLLFRGQLWVLLRGHPGAPDIHLIKIIAFAF